MLGILGSFAEFERAIIRERQAEGIALAKKAGKYKGRKPALSPQQVAEIKRRVLAGEPKAELAREFWGHSPYCVSGVEERIDAAMGAGEYTPHGACHMAGHLRFQARLQVALRTFPLVGGFYKGWRRHAPRSR